MLDAVSLTLFAAAAIGLAILALQLFTVVVHLKRRRVPERTAVTPISILKPLCGVDDDLATNLEHFATLDYPQYELLLGVRDRQDAAWPLALACARRHPGRVRVILQRGAPGLNPKVNQLITLEREARHGLVLISDSNIRVRPGYLDEIAAALEDPQVGLVTHPIVGIEEERLGSLLDNLHLVTHCATGTISAKMVAGKDLVIGKSMAMRRADLAKLGGFASVMNVLAEDYVIGKGVSQKLGKRVFIGGPIDNVSQRRTLSQFISRFQRWAVMQRKIVGLGTYTAQVLLNPITVALVAALCAPGLRSLSLLAGVVVAKLVIDGCSLTLLRGAPSLRTLAAIPLKDAVAGWAWFVGLLVDTVDWRGTKLKVLTGSRLATADGEPIGHAESAVEAA